MQPTRRRFVSTLSGAIGGAALAACASSDAEPLPKTTFVLVHGSWHGAWCFEPVSALLTQSGYPVIAKDLPGHGLTAGFPAAYSTFPRTAAFSTEPSPLAGVTLADYVAQITATVDAAVSAGSGPVILLGHSMGGLPIQVAAERLGPTKIKRLVYLAAFMVGNNKSAGDVLGWPTQSDSPVPGLLRSDPAATGALRIDPDSPDAAYAASAKAAFYGDVSAATVRAAMNLLTPDDPAQPFGQTIVVTAASWGAIPRTFIKCQRDFAVRPGTVDRMVAEADAFTPGNRTDVISLDTSHSPFFSQPQALATVLLRLA